MRTYSSIFIAFSILMLAGPVWSSAGENPSIDADSLPDMYRQFSIYTDPCEYVYLYKSLPESLDELCRLIKCQFIHPFEAEPFKKVIPPERQKYGDPIYPTVRALLKGLLEYDPNGLVPTRQPKDRLIVTCRYHAILLASILKHSGVPTRVRYGFALYIGKDVKNCHVICEVWDSEKKRWLLVDPTLPNMVDFPREQFEFASDAWHKLQEGNIDPKKYGVADRWGSFNILDMFCHDMESVLGRELLYWEHPSVCQDENMDVTKIDKEQVEIIDKLADLMDNPDESLKAIEFLRSQNEFLQFKRSGKSSSAPL